LLSHGRNSKTPAYLKQFNVLLFVEKQISGQDVKLLLIPTQHAGTKEFWKTMGCCLCTVFGALRLKTKSACFCCKIPYCLLLILLYLLYNIFHFKEKYMTAACSVELFGLNCLYNFSSSVTSD
jgi:hypothetical protein